MGKGKGRTTAASDDATAATAAPDPPEGELVKAVMRFKNCLIDDQVHWIAANLIRVNPLNWRTHPEYQTEALRSVLTRIGVVAPSVVRVHDDGSYELLDGHLRRDLNEGGLMPCVLVRLTDQEAKEILATFDRSSQLAVADQTKLADLFKDLQGLGTPLADLGWPDYSVTEVLGGNWTPPASLSLGGDSGGGAGGSGGGGPSGGSAGPGEGEGGAGKVAPPGEGGVYKEQFAVICVCKDAAEQELLYNRLLGEGLNVKVVVT